MESDYYLLRPRLEKKLLNNEFQEKRLWKDYGGGLGKKGMESEKIGVEG